MEGVASAALAFEKHKVYIDFKPKFIEFGVDMCPKVYWANIQADNTHRSYYRFFYKSEFSKAFYSPE